MTSNLINKPFVSVVIPVLNDAVRLKTCLESLERQTYPIDAYEVIVVDNGSVDNVKEIVERSEVRGERSEVRGQRSEVRGERSEEKLETSHLTPMTYHLKYIHEPIKGLHRARNTGIKAAKGEILAFTDADCIPANDWLEKGVSAVLSAPDCGLVAGRIEVFAKNPDKPTAVELFEKITAFRQKEYIQKMHFAAPANAFILRSVIDKVGPFDGTLKSGADVEFGQRIFQAGYKQVYAEDAVVRHPARITIRELMRKHARVAGGLHDIRKKIGSSSKEFAVSLKDDWPKGKDFLNIFSDPRLRGFTQRIKVFCLMLIVKYVRIFESLRLRLGGSSRW